MLGYPRAPVACFPTKPSREENRWAAAPDLRKVRPCARPHHPATARGDRPAPGWQSELASEHSSGQQVGLVSGRRSRRLSTVGLKSTHPLHVVSGPGLDHAGDELVGHRRRQRGRIIDRCAHLPEPPLHAGVYRRSPSPARRRPLPNRPPGIAARSGLAAHPGAHPELRGAGGATRPTLPAPVGRTARDRIRSRSGRCTSRTTPSPERASGRSTLLQDCRPARRSR